ncbi:MAG: molybdenum cofactor biosynthesis protein [Actinomycetota bacterium]
MKVRVRMFGALAQRCRLSEEWLELPEGARAMDVLGTVAQRHPEATGILPQVSVAVNLEMVDPDRVLEERDEVALLPPVAGGSVRIVTGVCEDPISIEAVTAEVAAPGAGGTVVFIGTVRSLAEDWGAVERLEYSIYRDMAERVLREVAEEAAAKWPLLGVCILHRAGDLAVGDQTVVVACSAPHRGEAFDACRYGIDEVKARAPVWKKEMGPGGERWVGLEGRKGTPGPGPGPAGSKG